MKIKHHIQKTFETTDGYDGIDSIENRLRDNLFLVVLNEGSFIGILTPSDIIESPHKLVVDCLHNKPRIDCEQDIKLVLKVMKESQNFVLPVFDRDVFVGIVLQAAITDFFLEYRNELERVVSERTAELSKANEQLRGEIEEYKLSKEKLAGILASVTDHMGMIDDQHNIVWANDFAKKLFGEDIIGRKCYNIYHRYDKPCKSCVVRRCFEDGNIHEHETEAILADGSRKIFWRAVSVAVRDNDDDRVILVVEVSRDITERKKAEKELKELNLELEQRVEARTSELLKSTQELLDTNNAISVLARNIDKNKEEAEKKIALTINSNIMPIVENLRNYKTLKNHQVELDVLVAYLQDITSNLLNGRDIIVRLSSTEMHVAAMIKNGLASKEIAGKLYISLNTVKTHRRNIRKKLNIHNSDINLANYLRQKCG